MDEYDGRQFVGIDLHRQRSVIVRQSESGEQLSAVRIVNDPVALELQLEEAGADPEVVLEATYGWYWAVDVLQADGARVHLAHPLGVKGFRYRRVKNDVRDAADLADLLRMGRLPEAWIAPPADARVAGVGALPRQAGRDPIRTEGPDPCGARQSRRVDRGVGPVRSHWSATAGQGATGPRLRPTNPLAAGTHRHPRQPRSALRRDDRRTVEHPPRLSSDPASARHRTDAGGGVRRRDR